MDKSYLETLVSNVDAVFVWSIEYMKRALETFAWENVKSSDPSMAVLHLYKLKLNRMVGLYTTLGVKSYTDYIDLIPPSVIDQCQTFKDHIDDMKLHIDTTDAVIELTAAEIDTTDMEINPIAQLAIEAVNLLTAFIRWQAAIDAKDAECYKLVTNTIDGIENLNLSVVALVKLDTDAHEAHRKYVKANKKYANRLAEVKSSRGLSSLYVEHIIDISFALHLAMASETYGAYTKLAYEFANVEFDPNGDYSNIIKAD